MLDRGQSVRKYIFIGDVMIYILKLLLKIRLVFIIFVEIQKQQF